MNIFELPTQSETINELSKSLAIAQGLMTCAVEDKVNPYFKSKYASLNSIWDSCRKALTENGLSVTQTTTINGESLFLITTLLHSSGQWMKSISYVAPCKFKPQDLGSALTYMRRYSMAAIVGISYGEDDDAESTKSIPTKQFDDKKKHPLQNSQEKPTVSKVETIAPKNSNVITLEESKSLFKLLRTCGDEFSKNMSAMVQEKNPNITDWKELTPALYKEILTEAERYLSTPREVINA